MNTQQAVELGKQIATLVTNRRETQAFILLAPVLAKKTSFNLLGRIGEGIGAGPLTVVNPFLKQIADTKTMGGWVVLGSALGKQLDRDLTGAFNRCRAYVVAADIWYASDSMAERVPGPALIYDLPRTLRLLDSWRKDDNRWARRMVGVAIHYWAKRSRGAVDCTPQAQTLLTFLEPMFEEQNMDAVKGVGWGLKTLGRYYPDLATEWLREQVVRHRHGYRAMMLHKALTYLPAKRRADVTGAAG